MKPSEKQKIEEALSLLSAERINISGLGAPINILKRLIEDSEESVTTTVPSAKEYRHKCLCSLGDIKCICNSAKDYIRNRPYDGLELSSDSSKILETLMEEYASLCIEEERKRWEAERSEILKHSVNAIYFNDSADYIRALWHIKNTLDSNSDIDELFKNLNP